jgi:hypothetical protein
MRKQWRTVVPIDDTDPSASVILSHDPLKASGFYKDEINYLKTLGYQFVQDGWVWRAMK